MIICNYVKGEAILRATVPPVKIPTATVAVRAEEQDQERAGNEGEKRRSSTTVGRTRGRGESPPSHVRPVSPPQQPPAGPPATAARGRRRSRGRLAAPPSSNRLLRQSSAAPAIPLGLGGLFFSGAGQTTPPPTLSLFLASTGAAASASCAASCLVDPHRRCRPRRHRLRRPPSFASNAGQYRSI
jgi:hypothetical protein